LRQFELTLFVLRTFLLSSSKLEHFCQNLNKHEIKKIAKKDLYSMWFDVIKKISFNIFLKKLVHLFPLIVPLCFFLKTDFEYLNNFYEKVSFSKIKSIKNFEILVFI